MTRYLFPDDPFLFRVSAPGSPLYSTINDPLVVYSDAGATSLADIEHVDHTPVFQSALMLNGTAIIPNFYGPDGVTDLWAQEPGGNIFQLTASSGPRLDTIESQLVSIAGVRQYSATLGTITGSVPYLINHGLENPWVTATLWGISVANTSGIRIPGTGITFSALSPNQLQIVTTASYTAGTVQITVLG